MCKYYVLVKTLKINSSITKLYSWYYRKTLPVSVEIVLVKMFLKSTHQAQSEVFMMNKYNATREY